MSRLRRRQRVVIGVLSVALGLPLGGIPAGATTTFQKTLAGPSIAEMYPSGVEWDGPLNRIVVADTGRDRIDFYAPNGTKQGEFGIHGPADGQFDSSDVRIASVTGAVDGSGTPTRDDNGQMNSGQVSALVR